MFAIAEFGSISRNTSDRYSDRDLLIVCAGKQHPKLCERYTKSGYSVSVLTPKQLFYMQQRGSLFIQHLKNEAEILIDSNGMFSSFLRSCDLVSPSTEELQICKSTIEFIGTWSNSVQLSAWKADFLFCTSRDLLIKDLATRGVVAFGLEDLEQELYKCYGLPTSDFANLYVLRRAKAAYRYQKQIPSSTMAATTGWLDVMGKVFDIALTGSNKGTTDTEIYRLTSREYNSPYERLRSLEAAYLIARSANLFHPEHDSLMRCILTPNNYGSSQIRKVHIISQYLNEVVGMLVRNPVQATFYSSRYSSPQLRA